MKVVGGSQQGAPVPFKVDENGALIVTGSGAAPSATELKITDGTNDATITDVGGKKSLDVNVTDININHASDSMRIGDGTNLVTSTPISSKQALDVNALTQDEKVVIDEASSTITYIGYAPIGTSESSAAWKIKRISLSGSVSTVTFADGNSNYDNQWSNRASLTYS